MDQKLKHLELIQGVINRLSVNSFMLKGWSVVLVSALFALAAPNAQTEFVYLAYLPAIVFWGLDGFFLSQERLFRALYNHVRLLPEDQIDFSMDTRPFRKVKDLKANWPSAVLSRTLIPFHGVLLASIIVVMALGLIKSG